MTAKARQRATMITVSAVALFLGNAIGRAADRDDWASVGLIVAAVAGIAFAAWLAS